TPSAGPVSVSVVRPLPRLDPDPPQPEFAARRQCQAASAFAAARRPQHPLPLAVRLATSLARRLPCSRVSAVAHPVPHTPAPVDSAVRTRLCGLGHTIDRGDAEPLQGAPC